MSFTETTTEAWFSRIGGAFKGILVGGLLFLIAFPLEFWNEGRAVKRSKTLAEGKGAVVADVQVDAVNQGNEGKLVHMTGEARSDGALTDDKFGITAPGALRLRRNVEMYQWIENVSTSSKKNLGGSKATEKTYSYSQEWSSSQIDSSDFHQKGQSTYGDGNPAMPFETESMTSQSITVGAFRLSDSLSSMVNQFEDFDVSDQLASVPEAMTKGLTANAGGFYIGEDPANPRVGDLKVTYSIVKPSTISLVSQQSGDSFVPYTNSTGSIEELQMGKHSAESMFEAMEAENTFLTWLLRAVGVGLMIGGLGMMMSPLPILADILPIAGSIVGAGTWLVAVLIGAMFSLLTISFAWIFYRPIIGIPLLLLAIGLGVLAWKRTSKSKSDSTIGDATPAVT